MPTMGRPGAGLCAGLGLLLGGTDMNLQLLALATILVCASPAVAQSGPVTPPVARTVTLAPAALTVREAVQAFAAQTGERILVAPGVTGSIGISLKAVPLEYALTAVTKGTGNTWSRLTMPADKADGLAPETAETLSRAADAIAAARVTVRTADGHVVTAATASLKDAPASPTEDAKAVVVYVVRSTQPTAVLAAEQEKRDAEVRGTNLRLGDDAKSDPAVVNAYSALRSLSPDQTAILTREFITHLTPDEGKMLQQAFAKQQEQMKAHPQQ